MKKITIFLFGDSITRGSFDTESGGWADRLKACANEVSVKNDFKPIITVFNLGIGGNTSTDILKRFIFETEQRLTPGGDTYFVFSAGTNDAAVLSEKNEFAVSKEVFKNNIETLIQQAKNFSTNIAFLTCPPVIDEITKNASHVGKTRQTADIEAYNAILRESGVEIIDVFAQFRAEPALFVQDGLHPNSRGHAVIFELVKDYFVRKGILNT